MDGFSVTYSLFQIAIFWTQIIICLEQDCNYSPASSRQYFMGDKVEQKYNPYWKQTGNLICNAFEYSKDYCNNHDIKVINVTRGGMFDVFPRAELEDLLM